MMAMLILTAGMAGNNFLRLSIGGRENDGGSETSSYSIA